MEDENGDNQNEGGEAKENETTTTLWSGGRDDAKPDSPNADAVGIDSNSPSGLSNLDRNSSGGQKGEENVSGDARNAGIIEETAEVEADVEEVEQHLSSTSPTKEQMQLIEELAPQSSDQRINKLRNLEMLGEHECDCTPPCECPTPTISSALSSTMKAEKETIEEIPEGVNVESYQLDEMKRAKEYLLRTSTKSGLNLYDHLSEMIRKILDERGPENPVDYIEEISMNLKRYKFGMAKDRLKECARISKETATEAHTILDIWKDNIDLKEEINAQGEGKYNNVLKTQDVMEETNVGLSADEAYRVALMLKDFKDCHPEIKNERFWGKINGRFNDYYVIEADNRVIDEWQPQLEGEDATTSNETVKKASMDQVMSSEETFQRAGTVVVNTDILAAYSKGTELGAGEGGKSNQPESNLDAEEWKDFMDEMMNDFPVSKEIKEIVETIPPEDEGEGTNNKIYYVCSSLGQNWTSLPSVDPMKLNLSRKIRWAVTGNLNGKIKTLPSFDGWEADYVRGLIARANAGGRVSPKGFFNGSSKKYDSEMEGEEDDDDYEEEDISLAYDGNLTSTKQFKPDMKFLLDPSLKGWVHHIPIILKTGRVKPFRSSGTQPRAMIPEGEDDSNYEEEEEEEEEQPGEDFAKSAEINNVETPVPLFRPVAEDVSFDGKPAWTRIIPVTLFSEVCAAGVRSNTWPGYAAVCSSDGRFANIYIGDGLKFRDRCYCPEFPIPETLEQSTEGDLVEVYDPSVQEEAAWLEKLELQQIADVEEKFVDVDEEQGGEFTSDEEMDEEEDSDF